MLGEDKAREATPVWKVHPILGRPLQPLRALSATQKNQPQRPAEDSLQLPVLWEAQGLWLSLDWPTLLMLVAIHCSFPHSKAEGYHPRGSCINH